MKTAGAKEGDGWKKTQAGNGAFCSTGGVLGPLLSGFAEVTGSSTDGKST